MRHSTTRESMSNQASRALRAPVAPFGDAPAPAPDAAPAPAPAEVFPDDIEELDVDYPMEDQYGEAPAPAPAP